MNRTAWLAQRALLAIALMIGFYVLSLAVALALVWLPYAEWQFAHRIHPKLALFCVITAGAIVAAIVPRRDQFTPPGPRADEASHPALFTAIRSIASATGQDMPREVYLVNEVNAWVGERGGIMGVGGRRVMGLGLPLVAGLTVNELKAVLAHEFGHYAASDVKLGPWIYKTRVAIGRAIENLGDSWLTGLFNAYGRLFLRLTHAISREQEYLADALAARTVSAAAMASALRRTQGLAPAFNVYWNSEVSPAVNAGVLPPLTAGFAQFISAKHVSERINQLVASAESDGDTNEFDTHPALRDRLRALARLAPPSAQPMADVPASTLLPRIEEDAEAVLRFSYGVESCATLRRVSWDEVGGEVYPRQWREAVKRFARFLAPFTADALPSNREELLRASADLPGAADMNLDRRLAYASDVLGVALAVSLLDAGATVATSPGHPLLLRIAEEAVDPFSAVRALAEGTVSAAEWQARTHALGVAGRPLGSAAGAA